MNDEKRKSTIVFYNKPKFDDYPITTQTVCAQMRGKFHLSDLYQKLSTIIDPEARIAAKVGVVRGLVKGEFNSAIIISQIAQNEEIRPEDLVLTSGEGGGYWPGLTIGRIVIVKPGQNGIFKEAEVAPLIDYSKLEIVYVNAD